MNSRRLAFATAAALVLAAGSAAADVESSRVERASNGVRSVAVRYEREDLGRADAARTLHERLEAAASKVCGPRPTKDLRMRRQWQECYEEALTAAVQHIGDPRVAALAE